MLRTPASTWRSGSSRCEEDARAGFADGAAWARALAVEINSIAATPDKGGRAERAAALPVDRLMANLGAWSENSGRRQFQMRLYHVPIRAPLPWRTRGITAMTGAIFGDTVSFVTGRRALPCCDPFPSSLPCWARWSDRLRHRMRRAANVWRWPMRRR